MDPIRARAKRSIRRPLVVGTLSLLILMVASGAVLSGVARNSVQDAARAGSEEVALSWLEHDALRDATHAASRVAGLMERTEAAAESVASHLVDRLRAPEGSPDTTPAFAPSPSRGTARLYDPDSHTYAVAPSVTAPRGILWMLDARRDQLGHVMRAAADDSPWLLHIATWMDGHGVVGYHAEEAGDLALINLPGGFGAEALTDLPLDGPRWSERTSRGERGAVLSCSVPARDAEGQLVGIVRADVDVRCFAGELAAPRRAASMANPVLVDGRSRVLAMAHDCETAVSAAKSHEFPTLEETQRALDVIIAPDDLSLVAAAGSVSRRYDSIVAMAPVAGGPWAMVLVTPVANQSALAMTAADPAVSVAQNVGAAVLIYTTVFCVIAALGGLLFADWLRRRLDPVLAGANEFAAGNLRHRIQLSHDDEITSVSVALNSSAERLDQTVKRLEESRRRLSGLIQGMAEGLVITDVDDRISFVNTRFAQMLRRQPSTLIGRKVEEFVAHDSVQDYRRQTRLRQEGDSSRYEIAWELAGEESPRTIVAGMPLYDEDGEYCGSCGVVTDITHRARAQAETARADKLRALGEMAGGVAHDFNNILTAVLGNAQYLMTEDLPKAALDALQVIERAALDGTETVRRIREFTKARSGVVETDPVDANALVWQTIQLARPRIEAEARARGVRYEVAVHRTAHREVRGNAPELRETLLNLVNNAVDAMPNGGALHIEAFDRGEDMVGLRVGDSGEGIPPEVLDRIFDPFFSTKRDHHCSGLGLSICYGIVRAHGGRIDVRSAPDEGTTFTVVLPAYAAAISSVDDRSEPPPPPSVLYVAPLTQRARALQRALEGVGVDVTLIEGGDAAEKAFADPRMIFNVLMAENEMGPRISGWQVARQARLKRSELRIILLADPTRPVDESQARNAGIDDTLMRPFDASDVRQALTRVLSRPSVHLTTLPSSNESDRRDVRRHTALPVDETEAIGSVHVELHDISDDSADISDDIEFEDRTATDVITFEFDHSGDIYDQIRRAVSGDRSSASGTNDLFSDDTGEFDSSEQSVIRAILRQAHARDPD